MPIPGYHTNKAYLSTEWGRCNTTTHGLGTVVYERQSYSPVPVGQTNYGFWLQLGGHKEVSLQAVRTLPNQHPTALVFDYMLKDHLGNVRMPVQPKAGMLTEEIVTGLPYAATMEDAVRTKEEDWFEGIGTTVANKPTGFDATSSNQKVSQLFNVSGQDKRTGPAIVLKVMSGDKFRANVQGWYLPGSNTAEGSQSTALHNLLGSVFGNSLPTGSKVPGAIASSGIPINILPFLQNRTPNAGAPKAFLSYMLLDELELKLDASVRGSTAMPVITGTMQAQLLQAAGGADITITKNGYLFVFVSNESQGSVYFDNLTVTHTPGPLLEEHHYYPTGLEMFALSSSAGNGHVRNRYTYQGQECENTFALNLNEFEARHYDGQIGRWMVPDPAKQFASPYVGMGNEWVSGVDPDGRWVDIVAAAVINIFANKDQIKKATEGENGNPWRGIGMALGYGAVGALGAWTGGNLTKFFDLSSAVSQLVYFGAGGSLNVGFEAATGQFKDKDGVDVNVAGRIAGSFITGGLSALAGKNWEGSLKSGEGLSDIQNRIFSANDVFKFNPLKGSSLVKFGLSGLQNVASNLNKHNGNLKLAQIGNFFLAGVGSGFASYSLSYLGYSKIPKLLRENSFSYGLSAIATPILANGITDMGLSYFNYKSYYGKPPKDFKSFYNDYLKYIHKIGFYTFSSILGHWHQNNVWNILRNPPSFGLDTVSPPQ